MIFRSRHHIGRVSSRSKKSSGAQYNQKKKRQKLLTRVLSKFTVLMFVFGSIGLIFGAAIGALLAGKLADRFGRKSNIFLLAIIFIVSTTACALAPSWKFLAFARFILGFAVGGASVTVPIYLAELSPYEKRGSLVTQNELMIIVGHEQ